MPPMPPLSAEPAVRARLICETKRMPSLRSERDRREMQAVQHVSILSRFASFPACLAAGPACVLPRLCAFVEQITLAPTTARRHSFACSSKFHYSRSHLQTRIPAL